MIESGQARSLLCRKELTRVRAMAVRRGIWYRRLNVTERALLSLAVRLVKEIRSDVLSRSLASIIEKLRFKTEGGSAVRLHKLGQGLAERIGRIACRCGNTSAAKWSVDDGFARFLTILYINKPFLFMEEKTNS